MPLVTSNAHPDAVSILTQLAEQSSADAKLWTKGDHVRLYLADVARTYITVDKDGDLLGHGPKLSRAAAARVWGPWEKAARAIDRKLYA